jgi:hypothetical protein
MSYDVKIGRRTTIRDVPDFATASRLYGRLRDESGEAYSTFPDGWVVDRATGRRMARVSYNGKVWHPAPWTPASAPLFDPSADANGGAR